MGTQVFLESSDRGMMTMARGNAFHQLQAFVQPYVKHRVIQMLDRVEIQEDSSLPDSSLTHILRQAVKIQRGEEVGLVTALTLARER
jgi:hypothetical protein